MISRQWKCILKEASHDEYITFLNDVVFAAAKELPGFIQANILKRKTTHGLEFMVTTLWENLDAIKAFAGEDTSLAMVPEAAQRMMVSFDEVVVHYEVIV
jgi:heme-degrading monooxygenase HmoA